MKDYIIENFSGVMSLGDRTAESFFLNIIVALVIFTLPTGRLIQGWHTVNVLTFLWL